MIDGATLSSIVRVGVWKEVKIENFCAVIPSNKDTWNSMATYTDALLKSKKFDLDEGKKIDV